MIRNAVPEDAPAICDIYNYYVRNTTITFELEAVTVEEMQKRIADVTADYPWLVYESDGRITGYAYATKWKSRGAYRYSVESTVYVEPRERGHGIGKKLYEALLRRLRNRSVHAVIVAIALPNESSVALNEKMGFKKVAHFEEVGWKQERWIDVGYWELILDKEKL